MPCLGTEASPTFLTLPEAAARLGAGGRRPSTVTLWRWCRKGVRGVKLEYARFGREIRVTPEALSAFGAAMAAADTSLDVQPATAPKKQQNDAQRARDLAAAEGLLRSEGMLSGATQ